MRLVGSLIVPLLGAVFLGLAGWWGWEAWAFVKRATPAQGKIDRLEQHEYTRRSGGITRKRVAYHPVFTFQDAKGASHTVVSSSGSGRPQYEAGAQVPVLYDPAEPQNARIDSFSEFWLFPIAFGGIGGACFLVAIFTRRRSS